MTVFEASEPTGKAVPTKNDVYYASNRTYSVTKSSWIFTAEFSVKHKPE